MIKVVNKYKYQGTGLWVGRPTIFGNKWSHLKNTKAEFKVATREESVLRYKEWFPKAIKEEGALKNAFLKLVNYYQQTGELTLICCCDPLPCHAHIIAEEILKACNESQNL